MNKFTHNTFIAAAVCAALVTGARAEDRAQLPVKYADLDVTNVAGAKVLYERIKFAAAQVCKADDQRDLAQWARARACVDRAIAQAVAKVDAPALTGLYQAHAHGNTQLATTP